RVIALATEALATKTKDLQISAWLSEALVKQHGFTGLRDGLRLTRGLLEQFWDNFYPEIDEEDLEARTNVLDWMDRQVPLAMKEVSVTKSTQEETRSLLNECWEEFQMFSRAIDEKFGHQAPELGTLGRSLDSIRLLVDELKAVPQAASATPPR